MSHLCDVPYCDGTLLGHDLALEFPAETQRVVEAFDRLARDPRPARDERGLT